MWADLTIFVGRQVRVRPTLSHGLGRDGSTHALTPPIESDRERFVELFTNEAFMVFASVLVSVVANARLKIGVPRLAGQPSVGDHRTTGPREDLGKT